MVTYLGSLFQYCCGNRGTLQTNIIGMCGECLQCLGHTGFALVHGTCTFPLYNSQALGYSAGELSEAGPGLHALPWSKPLRFRFSGSPQRGRLSWASVFYPSKVRAAEATRCLASAVSPGEECILSPPWSHLLCFLGGSRCTRLQCAVYLFWELISGSTLPAEVNHPESQGVLVSDWVPACSLVEDASLGPSLPLSTVAAPLLPPCLQWEMGRSAAG